MGGHGGLNILPQKKWNVYNWDNRIKVMQNEKLVNEEVEKIKKSKSEKIFKEKINSIKTGKNFQEEIYENKEIHNIDKNKIYLEITKNKNLAKKIDNDVYFENRLTAMGKDERLLMHDENILKSEHQKKISKENESDDEKNFKRRENPFSEVTFKDSIKKHLQPWYLKKDKDDYIKNLTKVNKYFSKISKNEKSNENSEDEIDNNKIAKNYDELYERLEFDLNNKITVKDKFSKINIFRNPHTLEVDSDHLEFLKGEKNLMEFLNRKRNKTNSLEDFEKEKDKKKEKKHKKDKKKSKKDKKHKKHKKDKKEKRDKIHRYDTAN